MTSVVSQKSHSLRVTLATGYWDSAGSVPELNGTSRLLAVRRITAGGATGDLNAFITLPAQPVGAHGAFYGLAVTSSSATDASVVEVLWSNSYIASQYSNANATAP